MKKKILIVDDEQDLVETLTYRLEATGYEVLSAFDGHEGLNLAKSEHPDLILLDIMMPRMDGYQVCRILKADQEYRKIPIVMLTARGQGSDKDMGKDVGADEYVVKPFEAKDLLEVINRLLPV